MASFEEDIVGLLEKMEREGGAAYADAPYPSPVDACVEELSVRFVSGDEAQRDQIAQNLATSGPLLAAFVQRTGSAAAAHKDAAKLERAFDALAMGEAALDAPLRRALLGLLGKAAEKAGLGTGALHDRGRATPALAATSVTRDLGNKPWTSPWAELGFREAPTSDGFRYRRWWSRPAMWGWEERLNQIAVSVVDRLTGYGLWHLPCQVDESLTEVVEMARALSPFERPAVDKAFAKDRGILRAFAGRMATLAVRESSEQRLTAGLSALVVENFDDDARETTMELALLFDAARRIGVSPTTAFADAIAWARPQAAEQLRAYLARDPGLQRIESMGYAAKSDRDGFRYRHDWTRSQKADDERLCPYQLRAKEAAPR
jgi:hypothetical protein